MTTRTRPTPRAMKAKPKLHQILLHKIIYTCEQCRHRWRTKWLSTVPTSDPKTCPKCGRRDWDDGPQDDAA